MNKLFQARMWREYAKAWDGKPNAHGIDRDWVQKVLRIPRAECVRRARESLNKTVSKEKKL